MDNKSALQTVKEIKDLMNKSSRFLSFSGTSAILIGLFALVGAWKANSLLQAAGDAPDWYSAPGWVQIVPNLIVLSLIVFMLSLGTIFFFSLRKARKRQHPFFNKPAFRTFLNFLLPLIVGGVFCLSLLVNEHFEAIAPAMLIFYGLALVNASKYTYDNIFWLGCAELLLGIVSAFLVGNGLVFWVIGFGVLHILYGIYFYIFIERKESQW